MDVSGLLLWRRDHWLWEVLVAALVFRGERMPTLAADRGPGLCSKGEGLSG
jgi:hypothetical protein